MSVAQAKSKKIEQHERAFWFCSNKKFTFSSHKIEKQSKQKSNQNKQNQNIQKKEDITKPNQGNKQYTVACTFLSSFCVVKEKSHLIIPLLASTTGAILHSLHN